MQGLREGDLATVLPTARVSVVLSRATVQGGSGPTTKASPSLAHHRRCRGAYSELGAGIDLAIGGPECLCVGGGYKEKVSGGGKGAWRTWSAVQLISKSLKVPPASGSTSFQWSQAQTSVTGLLRDQQCSLCKTPMKVLATQAPSQTANSRTVHLSHHLQLTSI